MAEGYPDTGGWGVWAILKEAGRILRKYIWLLQPFILAFLLPVAVIQFLYYIWLVSYEVPHRFGGVFNHHHLHHHHQHHHHHFGLNALGASFKLQATDELAPFIMMLVSIAIAIVEWLLVNLAIGAISMAVQYIYSDREDPCIVKSIFKALPAALLRLFVTSLWIFLAELVIVLVVSLLFFLLSAVFKDKIILEFVCLAFLFVAELLVDFWFLLSRQVAVLEPGNYGLAALKRSFKLVQSKFPTAVALFSIYFIFNFTLSGLSLITKKFERPHWIFYILEVFNALWWLSFSSYWLLVTTVFYFSSKLNEEQLLPEENPYRPLAPSAEN